MRHDKEEEEPHKPEMPYAGCVKASEKCGQPMELHRLMNRPACSNRKKPGNGNRKVRCTLERIVLGSELRMRPGAAHELGERNAEVVSKHPERVSQITSAR